MKKKAIKTGGILLSLFGISFGIAFMSQYQERKTPSLPSTPSNETPAQTNQQKLLNNLMEIKAFDVKAEVEAMTPESNKVGISFDGKGDITDLENIKLEGKANANLDGNKIPIELSYVDSTTYFAYRDSKFRIDTDSIFEFIEKLPTVYGIELEVPEEIKNLDLNDLVDRVNNMEDKQITPLGDLCFKLNLSDAVEIFIKTDADNNFKGIRTNHFYYNKTLFYLNIDLVTAESVEILAPDYRNYQDFKPVFTIFDGIYNLTKKRQNTINVALDLKKQYQDTTTDEEGQTIVTKTEIKNLVGANLDLTYDFDNKLYSLDGKILANEKEAPFNFALYNKKIYAKYSDLKVSVQLDSITALIDYALSKIGENKIEEVINSAMDKMKDVNILDYINNADKMIGDIVLTDTNLDVDIAPGEAGFDNISDFKLTLSFDTNGLKSLSIINLSVKDYFANLVLTFGEYKPFTLVEDDYAELEPVLGLVDAYENYLAMPEHKFQIEFDGNVVNSDETIKPINIDGNIQFEIDPERSEETNIGYGYGYVNVIDRNEYKHNIKADMKSVDEILFTYNDTMNGKAKIRTLKELLAMVMDIIQNPDEHFEELFGEIIEKINNMPIKQVIDGDYLQLLTTNIINRFETGHEGNVYFIEIDIALDVINFSDYGFTLRLEYENKEVEVSDESGTYMMPNPVINSLKVYNCQIGEENVEFNIYLHDYDNAKDITRLDPYVEYIDFSDIKVLLQLGINTSKFNYYHFTATAKLNIAALGGINFDIPLDVKLHSQNGDIKLAIDFVDIPLISLVNKGTSILYGTDTSRKASLYYHDKMFYLDRTDTSESGLFFKTKYTTTITRRFDLDYMKENILNILLQDVMGANDTLMNLIERSANNKEDRQMQYEKILKNFIYNANENYFFFDIDIGELAKSDQLTSLTLKVRTDDSDEQLVSLDAHLGIAVGITINIDLSLDIADRAEVADSSNAITNLETFIAAHANDELNKLISKTSRV
ncbi:MAG: hypothetical protein J1F32_01150 [Erysipelotrichales bacterium]|nr:hypothetical protein [Erysipelotrichales bacterium]